MRAAPAIPILRHLISRNSSVATSDRTTLIKGQRFHTVVIGGGQAGLAVGYHLARRGIPFVILDANERIGDSWRRRWDSLRLFTRARYDALPGMSFPAPAGSFPTKDDMADYLEAYASHFRLPVYTGTRVDRLWKRNGRYVIDTGQLRIEADNVVVAMSSFQQPLIPRFAGELAPHIRQIASSDYRNPSQLQPGAVLVVGASNSGAEIALDIARSGDGRDVWLSGRHPGHLPYNIDGLLARFFWSPLLFRFVFHRIFTIDTPVGRKVRPKFLSKGSPLIRSRPRDLDAAGILRVPRMVGVEGGRPMLEDRALLNVTNVIWSAGFTPGFFSWIDLPVFSDDGQLVHRGGFTETEPRLFFVGLNFLYSLSSTMIQGVGRDAKRIVDAIASGDRFTSPVSAPSESLQAPVAERSAGFQREGTRTSRLRA